MAVNLSAPVAYMRACVPVMKARRAGAIVNVDSNVVAAARPHNAAYAAAKGGLLAVTKVLALELGAHGIRVNAVSPGSTMSRMLEQYDGTMRDAILKGSLEKYRIGIPLGRLADPEDTAATVAHLDSDLHKTSPARTYSSTTVRLWCNRDGRRRLRVPDPAPAAGHSRRRRRHRPSGPLVGRGRRRPCRRSLGRRC
jgi:NAD(P)-dependent dehydrogenase (short-subunit alcohol dehydrogenase family)